jgi:hypothetical protein
MEQILPHFLRVFPLITIPLLRCDNGADSSPLSSCFPVNHLSTAALWQWSRFFPSFFLIFLIITSALLRCGNEADSSPLSSCFPVNHYSTVALWHWSRFSPRFFSFPSLIAIPLLLYTHLLLSSEVCDNPQQAGYWQIPGLQVGFFVSD